METKELVGALSKVKFCTSNNPVLPIFSYVSLNKGFIETCNGTQGARLTFDAPFQGSVNLELFLNTLNLYTKVDSISKIDDRLELVTKKAMSTLQIFDDYVSIFDEGIKDVFNIEVNSNFINGLSKCLTTVDRNNLVESQSGVTIKIYPNKLLMFSISGFKGTRLSKYSYDVEYEGKDDEVLLQIVLPEFFCRYIVQLHKEDTVLRVSDTTATIQLDDLLFATRLEDITPIDFEAIIQKNITGEYTTIDKPQELVEAIDRAVVALSPLKDGKVISMTLLNKMLDITAYSQISSYKDSITLDIDQQFEFTIDAVPFQSTLKEIQKIGFYNGLIIGENDNYFTLMETN